jgi:hypothetical protein
MFGITLRYGNQWFALSREVKRSTVPRTKLLCRLRWTAWNASEGTVAKELFVKPGASYGLCSDGAKARIRRGPERLGVALILSRQSRSLVYTIM